LRKSDGESISQDLDQAVYHKDSDSKANIQNNSERRFIHAQLTPAKSKAKHTIFNLIYADPPSLLSIVRYA